MGVLGFYFFDKQRPLANSVQAAFRSIVAQVLHSKHNVDKLVDLALLVRDTTGSGQTIASDEEINNLLACYLDNVDEARLVFDGLDECADPMDFVSSLGKVLSGSCTHILLCSRPNITVDHILQNNTRTLCLGEDANFQDIETYLRPEIWDLVRTEKLILEEPVDVVCHQIAKRSHSMFLWANLMVNYLKSDFLSPQDRIDAIEEVDLFEELDQFYTKILKQLFNRCPSKRARENLQRLFHWISLAQRQLTVAELRSALAIQAGMPTKKSRYIPRIAETVTKMSGALVEISKDDTVRFIHTSVLEFFLDAQTGSDELGSGDRRLMTIDLGSVHAALAWDCMSYIHHDTPREPLVSTFSHQPHANGVLKRFPLLLYATQFWPVHVEMCLRASQNRLSQHTTETLSKLSLLLKSFFADKRSVTTWTEAAWTFKQEPSLGDLPRSFELISNHDIASLRHTVISLAADLLKLNTSWGAALYTNPGLIWQPDIPAFMKSEFWVGTEASATFELDRNQKGLVASNSILQPILVASQTSEDGNSVGLIKLWPSR